ncbi:MOS1T transposase, partial [Pseudoatta argentina]
MSIFVPNKVYLRGILLHYFIQKKSAAEAHRILLSTITGDRYRLQLMRLSRALKEKRPLYAQRHDKVILLHDNARPHVANPVKTYLETLKWEGVPHPLYSPDIAPSDFHLFRSMAHGLADRRFHSYGEAQKWIDSWIASKDMSFFRRGIHVLPERWEKIKKGMLSVFLILPSRYEKRSEAFWSFLLSRNDNSQGCRGVTNATATNSQANMHLFVGCRVHDVSSSGGYQPAAGRGRRPFLIIHRRWQRRNRRDRDWAEMISARRVKDKEPGGERRKIENDKERERGRGAKNEVKFIRVQTDVNLFKLRDFGSGRDGREGVESGEGQDGERWGLLRRNGSGSICFITTRDKGWAWSEDSILREIKKSAGLSFRSRFSVRKREACGPVPYLACTTISYCDD